MYPNLYYFFKDCFGIEWPLLAAINSFGLMVALGFVSAIYFFKKELQRKEKQGLLTYTTDAKGNKKWPHERVGDATLLAAFGGIVGGKLFASLEDWDRFIQDPVASLTSFSGMTFYGSLIVSTALVWWYFNRHKITPIIVADAIAPALMIAYAIGRLGCQFAGDGDWGVINHYTKPFAWLPGWLWAYNYPHNILQEGSVIPGCNWGNYCFQLDAGVYPTPLYEMILCTCLFLLLWFLRKKIVIIGRLCAVYLFVNGAERLLIEQIRINEKVHFLGMHVTQAEIVSVLFMMTGAMLYYFAPKLKANATSSAAIKNQ